MAKPAPQEQPIDEEDIDVEFETDEDELDQEGLADEDNYASLLESTDEPEEPELSAIENDADLSLEARPVPRITIHAYCSSPETGVVLQRAASDRRLTKAHVTVHMGGLAAAIGQYKHATTPNLVIVEDHSHHEELFANLLKFAEVCDPATKVMVIGKTNDVGLYRELIKQGVSEYLVSPLTPLQIIASISSIYVDPAAPPIGRSIAFVGAKGGVGSSTIAHHVGWCMSEGLEEDVTLIDLDIPFGTAGLDFNQDATQGIADALTSPERLDDVLLDRLLVKCTDHLSLFASPSVLDRDLDLDTETYESVLEIVRNMVPTVVLDVPHIWTPWTKHVLFTSDEVILTATPDLASLRNVKNIVDLVRAARPNDSPPRLVLNQVGVPKRPEIPEKDFAEATGIEPSLIIPFDAQLFGTAANNGQMVTEVAGNNKIKEGLKKLSFDVSGREPPETKNKGLLSMLGIG